MGFSFSLNTPEAMLAAALPQTPSHDNTPKASQLSWGRRGIEGEWMEEIGRKADWKKRRKKGENWRGKWGENAQRIGWCWQVSK